MPWLGTFHAIGTKILRRHAELVGLKSDFTILGTDDQIRLMKQVIADQNIDEKRWPARALAHTIDGWKNRGLSPRAGAAGRGAGLRLRQGGALYTAYQARLATLNAVDFGDLLAALASSSGAKIRTFSATTKIVSNISWSMSIRIPMSRNISGCGCTRNSEKTSPASATTTSRSMAGAASRGRQHPALRARLSLRHRGPLGAQLPLDRHILAAASG